MTLTRSALDELLHAFLEQLVDRLATVHDPIDIALWLERRVEVIRGFAAPDDREYLEARLADVLPHATDDAEAMLRR